MPHKDPEQARKCKRQYYQRNRAKFLLSAKQRQMRLRPSLIHYARDYYRRRMLRLRSVMFEKYGQVCSCCGEFDKRLLTLDHVNNDGNVHRKQLKTSSPYTALCDIARQGWPDTYAVLCMNCNWGKARNNGICPHKD